MYLLISSSSASNGVNNSSSVTPLALKTALKKSSTFTVSSSPGIIPSINSFRLNSKSFNLSSADISVGSINSFSFSADKARSPAKILTNGDNFLPIASPKSPAEFLAWSNAPAIVSACALACPPNKSAILFVSDSSRSVLPTAPVTSIPYLDKALVDEPNVLAIKSPAPFKSIPIATAISKVASVAFLIWSSESTNAAIDAWTPIIDSSPNTVIFWSAEAWFNNACDVFPSATSNLFSACSCSPAKVITELNPDIKPLAPK